MVKTGQVDDHIERLEAIAGEEQCKKLFHGSLLGPVPHIKDQNTAVDITGKGDGLDCCSASVDLSPYTYS